MKVWCVFVWSDGFKYLSDIYRTEEAAKKAHPTWDKSEGWVEIEEWELHE